MSEMTRRERVLRCYNFESPDRMPIEQAFYSGALIQYGQALIDLMNQYPNDMSGDKYADYADQIRDLNPDYHSEDVDPWGVKWEGRYEGILGMPLSHPLADLDNLKDYEPPKGTDTDTLWFLERTFEVWQAKQTDITGYAGPWLGGLCLFERMQWLRGYENLMMDFAEDRPELHHIADMIVDVYLHEIEAGGQLAVDLMAFADDWGTQERLMISPAQWREFFKPRYKKMFEACHAAGARVQFHSDGMILDIIPDLIEIGMDIFRPQFSCVDIRKMAAMTKGKVTTVMDLDRQYVLPFGTPEEVREHVKEVVEVFGLPEGGLIGRGEIMPDVPMENAKAMMDALVEFGQL
jgi:uroporphyrinogen decarboxylase